MTPIEIATTLIAIGCICIAIAIKLGSDARLKASDALCNLAIERVVDARRKLESITAQLKDAIETAPQLVDTAYKRGIVEGVTNGVEKTLAAVTESIDSGCDVDDIRAGMIGGYIPVRARNGRLDA